MWVLLHCVPLTLKIYFVGTHIWHAFLRNLHLFNVKKLKKQLYFLFSISILTTNFQTIRITITNMSLQQQLLFTGPPFSSISRALFYYPSTAKLYHYYSYSLCNYSSAFKFFFFFHLYSFPLYLSSYCIRITCMHPINFFILPFFLYPFSSN